MEAKTSSTKNFSELTIRTGSQIALRSAVIPEYITPYSDGGTVTLGDSVFTLPETHNRAEFETEFNKNPYLRCSWDGNRWTVKPKKEIFGELTVPTNVFENADKVQKKIQAIGVNHWLVENRGLVIDEKYFRSNAGILHDTTGYKLVSGDTGVVSLGNGLGVEGILSFTNAINFAGDEQNITADSQKSNIGASAIDNQIFLEGGDAFVSTQTFDGVFYIGLHGDSEGLLMNSPTISIVKNHADQPFASFRMRAGECIELKNMTLVTALDSKANRLLVKTQSNKVQLWQDVEGVESKVLQGDIDLPSECSMCLTAIDKTTMVAPTFRKIETYTSDTGSLCVALKTPNQSTCTLLQTNVVTLKMNAGFLEVNSVVTSVPMAVETEYVISASVYSQQVEASALDLGSSVLSQYASTSAEGTYVSQASNTGNFISMSSLPGVLGMCILVYANSDTIEKQILQEVLSIYHGGSSVSLGTYADGDFSLTDSTYDEKTGVLTHSSVEYTRIVPTLSPELRNIFRLPSEIPSEMTSDKKGYVYREYKNRIHCVGIDVSGLDKKSLIWEGKQHGNVEVANPVYLDFGHKGGCVLHTTYIDAQNYAERNYGKEYCSYTISIK